MNIFLKQTMLNILGDDMISFMDKKEACDYYILEALNCGFDANIKKQMVSNNCGEYLRLLFLDDGKVYGCIARSLTNFVHGNVETVVKELGINKVNELVQQISTLYRRQGNSENCQILMNYCIGKYMLSEQKKVGLIEKHPSAKDLLDWGALIGYSDIIVDVKVPIIDENSLSKDSKHMHLLNKMNYVYDAVKNKNKFLDQFSKHSNENNLLNKFNGIYDYIITLQKEYKLQWNTKQSRKTFGLSLVVDQLYDQLSKKVMIKTEQDSKEIKVTKNTFKKIEERLVNFKTIQINAAAKFSSNVLDKNLSNKILSNNYYIKKSQKVRKLINVNNYYAQIKNKLKRHVTNESIKRIEEGKLNLPINEDLLIKLNLIKQGKLVCETMYIDLLFRLSPEYQSIFMTTNLLHGHKDKKLIEQFKEVSYKFKF